MFRKLPFAFGATMSVVFYTNKRKFPQCDFASRHSYTDIIYSDSEEESAAKISEIDEDEQWEIEKEKCSFCKHFLQSPCKVQFKEWSKCVDKAKADDKNFVEICALETEALIKCTSEHPEYFESFQKDESSTEDEEDMNDSEAVEEETETKDHVDAQDNEAQNGGIISFSFQPTITIIEFSTFDFRKPIGIFNFEFCIFVTNLSNGGVVAR
eukprot:gene8493-17512_t